MISCSAALSDQILQAARVAMPADPCSYYAHPNHWRHAGPKNEPLLPLLEALIDAATAVAKAVADNAFDDCLPLRTDAAKGLAEACYQLGDVIVNAANWEQD
jgi:hypothetical protein